MFNKVIRGTIVAFGFLLLGSFAHAQETTTTRTNRQGDTITDTRSLQNGQYTNNKSLTTPTGQTYTKQKDISRNSNGRLVTNETRTGPNGNSTHRTTTHGYYGNKTTVTGPKGASRTFYRRR